MLLSQENRFLAILGGLSNIAVLSKISGVEGLSRPYEFFAELESAKEWNELEPFVGKPLALRIGKAPHGRILHGYITELQQQGFTDGQFTYTARLEPWFKTLTLTQNLRVYQRINVPDMVCDIFRKRGFNDFEVELKRTYPKRDYCMQYKESDFDFVTRQLEQAGIFYFFRHTEKAHKLVLADHPACFDSQSITRLPYQSNTGTQEGYGLRSWGIYRKVVPASAEVNGYNVQKATALNGSAAGDSKFSPNAKLSLYDDCQLEEGSLLESQAKLHMERWESQSYYASATCNHPGLQVGQQFTLHGHSSADGSYAVEQQIFEAESNLEHRTLVFTSQIRVIPANKVYRPVNSVMRPYIAGVLSALVVGAAEEEVHTDAQGRIKIQFYWDKEHKKDDDSSCWIRVSQFLNGAKFGGQFLPRVGNEVLVSFVDGDPDSPLVTGTVYNGVKMPPFALPGQKTQSGFASRSTTKGTVEQGHTLCFEDKKGEECIQLHSEKDMQFKAKNDFSAQIERNVLWEIKEKRDTKIDKGHDTLILTEGNALTELKKGDKKQTLDRGNFATTVSAGNYQLAVTKGNVKINAGQQCTITANEKIVLKVGGSTLSITPTGIEISAPTIKVKADATMSLKSGASAELKAATVTVEGQASLSLKGALINLSATAMAILKGLLTKIG